MSLDEMIATLLHKDKHISDSKSHRSRLNWKKRNRRKLCRKRKYREYCLKDSDTK